MNDRFKFRVWITAPIKIDFYIFKDIAPADDWTKSLIKVGGK